VPREGAEEVAVAVLGVEDCQMFLAELAHTKGVAMRLGFSTRHHRHGLKLQQTLETLYSTSVRTCRPLAMQVGTAHRLREHQSQLANLACSTH
jgi:hypothetical protein